MYEMKFEVEIAIALGLFEYKHVSHDNLSFGEMKIVKLSRKHIVIH